MSAQQPHHRTQALAESLGVLAALITLWWAASHGQWVSKVFLPTPEATLGSLVQGLRQGELASFTAATVERMVLGWGLMNLITELLKSDQFSFPVVIRARTCAWAALCVMAAGAASALVVRWRIDRLDMVAALKTRE